MGDVETMIWTQDTDLRTINEIPKSYMQIAPPFPDPRFSFRKDERKTSRPDKRDYLVLIACGAECALS
ncbi:MAG: hypothetical protein LBD68_05560 [Zoogloeaceae bacterium]|jgi:hypothetical protein|nr:hypothetical protein [Zoogloeaceae bacterium]